MPKGVKRKRKRGRPSTLTPDVQKALVRIVRAGNYLETACAHTGVDYGTCLNWLTRGKAETSGAHREFREAIEKARAYAEQVSLRQIRVAARKEWTAAAWYLERTKPERWGRANRDKLELTGELTVTHDPSEEITRLIARLAERDAQGDGDPGSEPGGSGSPPV